MDCEDCQGQQNLFQCSPEYAHDLISWSVIIVVFYAVLTFTRFIPAARRAQTKRGRYAWIALALIFPFCGMTGYGTVILSGWWPDPAYHLKVWFMKLDAAACLLFYYMSQGHTLELGKDRKVEAALNNEDDSPLERIRKAQRILTPGDDE